MTTICIYTVIVAKLRTFEIVHYPKTANPWMLMNINECIHSQLFFSAIHTPQALPLSAVTDLLRERKILYKFQ